MEGLPSLEVFRLVGNPMQRPSVFVGGLKVGVMIPADAVRSECFSGQVEQLPSDLDGSEAEEMPRIKHLDSGQRSMEPHQAALKDIIRLHPAAQARVPTEHLPREFEEAVAGMVQQGLFCGRISGQGLT